jgi:hypothetical protein
MVRLGSMPRTYRYLLLGGLDSSHNIVTKLSSSRPCGSSQSERDECATPWALSSHALRILSDASMPRGLRNSVQGLDDH